MADAAAVPCPAGLRTRYPLAAATTLELGGPAEYYLRVSQRDDLGTALAWARAENLPVHVLAGGSNLVVADEGVPGLVLHLALEGRTWEREGEEVLLRAASGETWDEVVAESVARGLCGIECLSGIPGTVGAVPIQNVGAYGQEVAQVLRRVWAVDRSEGIERCFVAAECDFAYRHSRFRETSQPWILTEVELGLEAGGPPRVAYEELARKLVGRRQGPAEVREAVLELRRGKSMVVEAHDPNRRSVGSFFVNPVVDESTAGHVRERALALGVVKEGGAVPAFELGDGTVKLSAAWLVERAGFAKGTRRGAVGISTRHSLALVHHGGGRTAELIQLAREIVAEVRGRFGVILRPEPVFLGFDTADPISR